MKRRPPVKSPAEVLAMVFAGCEVITETGCWVWMSADRGAGYGVKWNDGRVHYVHRLAYEAVHGPIPARMVIDHMCRVTFCANPAHLRLVTRRINSIENSNSISAVHAAKTCCPRCGGAYTTERRYATGGGHRRCRPCKLAWWRDWKARSRSRTLSSRGGSSNVQ